jgi:hypothetical protein
VFPCLTSFSPSKSGRSTSVRVFSNLEQHIFSVMGVVCMRTNPVFPFSLSLRRVKALLKRQRDNVIQRETTTREAYICKQ